MNRIVLVVLFALGLLSTVNLQAGTLPASETDLAAPADAAGSRPDQPIDARQAFLTAADDAADTDLPQMPREIQDSIETHQRYMRDLSRALRESAEPRDWALASQVWAVGWGETDPAPPREQLLANAAAAAPDDTLVQWLWANSTDHAQGSCGVTGLNPERVRRMVSDEPDNAAVWLRVLDLAVDAKDDAGIDEALTRIAGAGRYDEHGIDLMRAWISVYARHPLPNLLPRSETHVYVNPDEAAEVISLTLAISQATINLTPPLQNFTTVCNARKDQTGQWQRYAICGDAARQLGSADSMSTRQIAHRVLILSGQQTSDDAERLRELRWLTQQVSGRLTDDDATSQHASLQYLRDYLSSGSEVDAMRRMIERAGGSLQPPPLWQPTSDTGDGGFSVDDGGDDDEEVTGDDDLDD